MHKLTRQIRITKLQGLQTFETKELALISVFSSFWIVSEIYFGPMISQLTHIHGVIQRLIGWFLMLILAELTGRFGRVTAMVIAASIATRIIRPMRIYAYTHCLWEQDTSWEDLFLTYYISFLEKGFVKEGV